MVDTRATAVAVLSAGTVPAALIVIGSPTDSPEPSRNSPIRPGTGELITSAVQNPTAATTVAVRYTDSGPNRARTGSPKNRPTAMATRKNAVARAPPPLLIPRLSCTYTA